MTFQPSDLWRWDGVVGRLKYSALGVVLFALKVNLDRLFAWTFFHRGWTIVNYFTVDKLMTIDVLPREDRIFQLSMLGFAVPFIWVGAVLTIRRLRDAGLPRALIAVYFIPLVNWLLLISLCIVPSKAGSTSSGRRAARDSAAARWIPRSKIGSAFFASLICVAFALPLAALSTSAFQVYGWCVFVGLPFAVGMTASILYGWHERRTWAECQSVAVLAVSMVAGAALLAAIEGALCLLMAAPIWMIFAMIGASVGYGYQFEMDRKAPAVRVLPWMFVALPALMGAESYFEDEPPVFSVQSVVEIDAPPQKVFPLVAAFERLPAPTEWIFRAGVAYPIYAEMNGRGVGAVRRCVFNTGAFVEPIIVWDEPNVLRFSVEENPEPMSEWSIYDELHPPHLRGFLVAKQGEFRLEPLDGRRTRLTGTTWYRHSMWPAAYWRLWSDYFIHTIHRRVLLHIQATAEQESSR